MKHIRKVGILGHFAFHGDQHLDNGQIIKTKIVANEIIRQLGEDEVCLYDTMGKWKFLLRLPITLLRLLHGSRNIIFMPAYKGVRIIVPLLVLLNVFWRRRLHYIVIGGWLPEYVSKYPLLRICLKRVNHIYVETGMMQRELADKGVCNVELLPNFKHLPILTEQELTTFSNPPYPLCTFSRVEKRKGIADAVAAVMACNKQLGTTMFTLDIYGLVQEQKWFDKLMEVQAPEIRYCGIVPFDKSTDTLRNYFALVFPTFYPGEGFAGTLIDAFSSGLPVIASNWRSNPDIVTEGKTGIIVPVHSVEALTEVLLGIAKAPESFTAMRPQCLKDAQKYQPSVVIQVLLKNL